MGLSSPVASRVNGDSVVVTMVVVVVANLFVHVVNDEGGREGGAYLCNAVLMVVVVFVVLLSLTFNAAATLFFWLAHLACPLALPRSPARLALLCLGVPGGFFLLVRMVSSRDSKVPRCFPFVSQPRTGCFAVLILSLSLPRKKNANSQILSAHRDRL